MAMVSIYDVKPAFQNLLRPLVGLLARRGVTANQVTVGAMLLSVAEGVAVFVWPGSRWPLLCLPLVLLVRMGLNAIDGMLAREYAMKSNLGTMLNELGDAVSDTALYLPLAAVPGLSPRAIVIIVVLAIVSEMTGVIAVIISGVRRYDGPMGKSDRAFVFGILGLALGLGFHGFIWLNAVLVLMAALLAVTILNRARGALKGARTEN